MSPEQMRSSKDVDERSDVYALAVILYEAISGAPPFDAESFAELAAMVLRGEAKSLNVVAPEVPLELSRIVARAMAPDRHHRHPSVRALAEALEPFASSGVTSLTELPRRAEVWAERQEAAADAEVSGRGPTAPPGGAMAPTTLTAGELTEALPVRPKDDTPRRLGIAAVVVIALLSSVGIGAWALRQGRGARVREAALEVADASVPSVRVDVADPLVAVVDAGQQVVGPGPTEVRPVAAGVRREKRLAGSVRNAQSVDAGAAHPTDDGSVKTQGLDAGSVESSGARQPLQAVREPVVGTRRPLEPRRFEPLMGRRPLFQGLLSVACDDDCLVTLPGSADVIEGPFTLRRTAPGLIQVQGRHGGARAVFRVEFSSKDDIVKLFADTNKGTIVVVTGK
jgi:serine/threonine-protein kinase